MDETEQLHALTKRVNTHDTILRGDGNGTPGLVNRVRTLETDREDLKTMMTEWRDFKAGWKGVRATLIVVGVILSLLGGGLGFAILEALGEITRELP